MKEEWQKKNQRADNAEKGTDLNMRKVTVEASTKYNILIGRGLFDTVGALIRNNVARSDNARVCVVTDENVDRLYGGKIIENLTKDGFIGTVKFTVPSGESSKSPQKLFELLGFLADEHFTRSDLLVALGGGVVGDLCGFAASIYLRGIRFVQIPSTLLAAVDSSVGGKTAVNLPEGKNLAGTFYQPSLVICDPDLLDSLPSDIRRDGFAEVIKYGIILDRDFFESLKGGDKSDKSELERIIARSVELKRDIVNADERDTGIRAILNFGHTLGHGIELHSNFTVSHGSAVAIGMVLAAKIAFNLSICDEKTVCEIENILISYGFDTKCKISAEELYNASLSDKKRSGNSITLILPEKIGKCVMKKFAVDRKTLFPIIEEAV